MKKANKFLQWLRRPHGAALALIYMFTALIIAASIVFAVVGFDRFAVAAYIVFALAAVFLGYAVYTLIIYAAALKRKIILLLKKNDFTASIVDNYGFKTTVFALVSFGITVAFSVMYLVSAIRYRQLWYGAIFGYYFILMIFRGGVMLADSKCKKRFGNDEYRYGKSKLTIYMASGALLIPLEIVMALAVTEMVLSRHIVRGGEVLAIANAAYTFFKMGMAVYNLVKAKRFNNPVTQSLRNLNFADACMSAVSLTVLMLNTFSSDASADGMLYIKASVGFAACAVIIVIAALMIISANRRLAALKRQYAANMRAAGQEEELQVGGCKENGGQESGGQEKTPMQSEIQSANSEEII